MIGKNLTIILYSKHILLPSVWRSPLSFSLFLHHHCYSTSTFDLLARKHDFPPELASRVASGLTHLKNPENAVSVLAFLKQSGFSNAQLGLILKSRPGILRRSLGNGIKPKIQLFQQEGFSSGDICKIISSNPPILDISVKNNIVPTLCVLKGILDSQSEVAKVLKRCPRLVTANFRNTVLPNVEFLKSCGIPMERIQMIFIAYPGCLIVKPEIMRKNAEKAKGMGLNPTSPNFVYAVSVFSKMSDEALELKLEAFRQLGFSDIDILAIFRKMPMVLRLSVENVKKTKEILLATGKFDISSIVNCPLSLACSIEKKYIPRLQILRILETKSLIKQWPSLATICILSADKFSDKFVKPYMDEVGHVFTALNSGNRK
ncbi:hypothetical protein ACS0TY_013204 [Phlomoides rotata]